MTAPKRDIVPLIGGLDQVTTPILVPPGRLLSSNNFEPDIYGGYRRMEGIERFDGRPSPSDSTYVYITGTITGTISVGDTITGNPSGATGKVVLVDITGTPDIIVVTKVTGGFAASDAMEVSAVSQGTLIGAIVGGAPTVALHADYKLLVATEYRADITVITGSGPVRGVWAYKDIIYAFRNNAGGTACNMWKATATGWSQITFGEEVTFTNAVGQISEGDTVTGLASGASGVVKRALLTTGTWTVAGVGSLVFSSITAGPFSSGEALQVGAVTKATSAAASAAITLPAGGRYVFDNINFKANADGLCMFFANGVGLIHEYDATDLVPIRTGLAVDTPKFIQGHQGQLVIGIDSEVQNSSIGDPYAWTVVTGASRIGLGSAVTNIIPQSSDSTTGVLVITTTDKTYIMYGTPGNYSLVVNSDDIGAYTYTAQNIGEAYFANTRGITKLQATQEFGDFNMGVLSNLIQPYMDSKRGLAVASFVVKSKNQYRVLFSDGTGVTAHVTLAEDGHNVSSVTFMPFDYGAHTMNNSFSFVDSSGVERIFAGGNDGYVYSLDKGTSFDGDAINSVILMVFNHMKSPYIRKRFRRAVLQFKATITADVDIGYDLSYGHSDTTYGSSQRILADSSRNLLASEYWGSFIWGTFTWGGSYLQEFQLDTPGVGENLSIVVHNNSNKNESFTIHTLIVNYSLGRMQR